MFSTGRLDEPQHVQGNTSQGERGERGGQIPPQNQSVQPPHPPSLLLFSKADIFTRTTAHCLDKCGIL